MTQIHNLQTSQAATQFHSSVAKSVDEILKRLGNKLVVATPLGLGKPNQLLNALYQRAKSDSSIDLTIITALSLSVPNPKSDLEKRFATPFLKRVYAGYVELDYLQALIKKELPRNITVKEFFLKPGMFLSNQHAQENYISSNYTHVARDLVAQGVNLIVQLIADDPERSPQHYSLSCNPDVTLDIAHLLTVNNLRDRVLAVGQVHGDLPYMAHDAEVSVDFFDIIIENPEYNTTLFSVPNTTVSLNDHLIGLYASTLIKDAGTLQIGIGAMSDAIVQGCNLRHTDNATYQSALDALNIKNRYSDLIENYGGVEPFETGLYGSSEMFVNGFRYLIDSGVVKRKVYDDLDLQHRSNAGEKISESEDGIYMHGGFYLGPSDFYQWLRDLSPEQQQAICMTSVLNVNQLDTNHELFVAQRQHARFMNTGLMATLNGAVVSDGLESGAVLSGVGGQYNFVAMAHQLSCARSVLMIRATRTNGVGVVESNVRENYGHITIPRHLRDIVITEYGIADLRSKTDSEVYKEMLNITDSRFQDELLAQAKKNRKIAKDYQIPPGYRENTPEKVLERIKALPRKKVFPLYPFGEEFTDIEEDLILALKELKNLSLDKSKFRRASIKAIFSKAFKSSDAHVQEALQRMGLDKPKGVKEKITANLLVGALKKVT